MTRDERAKPHVARMTVSILLAVAVAIPVFYGLYMAMAMLIASSGH